MVSLMPLKWYFNGMKTTIDRAGRVVIPKPLREIAGLRPGAPLRVEYRDGKIEIEPKAPKPRLVRQGSIMVISVPGVPKLTIEETNEWIRKSRDREI